MDTPCKDAIFNMEAWVHREFPYITTEVSVPPKGEHLRKPWILNISVDYSLVAMIYWQPDEKYKLFDAEDIPSEIPCLAAWDPNEIIHDLRKLIQNA